MLKSIIALVFLCCFIGCSETGKKVDEEEFLDLINSVYTSHLNRLQVAAVKFGIWKSAAFLEYSFVIISSYSVSTSLLTTQ